MKKIFLYTLSLLLLFTSCKVETLTNTIYVDRAPTEYCYGHINLKPTDSIVDIIYVEHMIYVIQDEIDLHGDGISIGKNSILQFTNGGCLKNGTIYFDDTYLDGSVKFKDCNFSGSLINKNVNLSWFGLTTNLQEEKDKKLNTQIILQVINCAGKVIIVDDFYPISETIQINKDITLQASNWSPEWYSYKVYEPEHEASQGFYTVNDISAFSILDKGGLNLYGIYIKGNPDKYTGSDNIIPNELTWALLLPNTGSLGAIYNCKIEGFTQGIRGIGGFLEKIQNTHFNYCRQAIFTVYTSDYDVFGCKFTNCMGNYSADLKSTPDKNDMNNLRHIGCAIYIERNGMVNFCNNQFENNFIDFILDSSDIIINIQESQFTNPTFASFYFYNDFTNLNTTPFMQLIPSEIYKIALDNIVISNNNFILNKDNVTNCIACFRETNQIYLNQERDRGLNIVFNYNTINDQRTSAPSNSSILVISNQTKNPTGNLTFIRNQFINPKASSFVNSINGNTSYFNITLSEGDFDISSQYYNEIISNSSDYSHIIYK